jgi:hypothetical protein
MLFRPLRDFLMRFPFCFALMRFPYEISCFFGLLRALRMRCHAFLAVMRCLYGLSCFLAAAFSF